MKAQVNADFIVECTWRQEAPSQMADAPGDDNIEEAEPAWTLHVDGASNLAGCRASLILADPDR